MLPSISNGPFQFPYCPYPAGIYECTVVEILKFTEGYTKETGGNCSVQDYFLVMDGVPVEPSIEKTDKLWAFFFRAEEERTGIWINAGYLDSDDGMSIGLFDDINYLDFKNWRTLKEQTYTAIVHDFDGAPYRYTEAEQEYINRRFRRFNPRVTLSKRTRFNVLTRDNYTCVYCGRKPPEVSLHVDHLTPKSRGGSDDECNLVTACSDCNLGKGNRHDGRDFGITKPS